MKNYIKLLQQLLSVSIVLFCTTNMQAQISGCTDSLATNFNPHATINDGSCLYDTAYVSPINSWPLPQTLNETSGLIIWNNKFWTHNDDTDNIIYALDTLDINNYTEYPLDLSVNNDWEEISQDDDFFYIGDFGNNVNGNRTNLKILRVDKTSLLENSPVIDTINFSYSLQNDFSPTGSNNTNFDCEAFVVSGDSIYLFTKEWVSMKSTIYSLPKTPGNFSANFISQYNAQGLITGATYHKDKRLIALSGYSQFLQPFILLLFDFHNNAFFNGNKRKISLNLPFHQVEGIATEDGLVYFITNERFTQSIITTAAKIHRIDLSDYLSNYINTVSTTSNTKNRSEEYFLYPNPATDNIRFKLPDGYNFRIAVYNTHGQKAGLYESKSNEFELNVSNYTRGLYYYVINRKDSELLKGKFIVE
jgi:hypothetical protein